MTNTIRFFDINEEHELTRFEDCFVPPVNTHVFLYDIPYMVKAITSSYGEPRSDGSNNVLVDIMMEREERE